MYETVFLSSIFAWTTSNLSCLISLMAILKKISSRDIFNLIKTQSLKTLTWSLWITNADWNKTVLIISLDAPNSLHVILKLTSHGILHYLWLADLSISFSQFVMSIFIFAQYFFYPTLLIPWFTKANESRYEPCGMTPNFSTGQNLLKKILRKDKYWHNQLRKAFWQIRWPQIMEYTVTL